MSLKKKVKRIVKKVIRGSQKKPAPKVELPIKDKIKVVFWDLDDTLWQGTLAEGDDVKLYDDRVKIISTLNSRGIVNSICSKNDFEQTKSKLEELGIWDLFVFPNIAFLPKGQMIKDTLDEMNLREDNALFIDDNDFNLREVEYYNPKISVLNCKDCKHILADEHLKGKKDTSLSRVKQYRILEEKTLTMKKYSSNDSFLEESNIQVELLDYSDDHLDRVYELAERTNQLNFTKNRMTKEELKDLAGQDGVEFKLIHVIDIFGDYGIVGFYALKENELIHFVFSCRIMSMNVEQFMYAYLEYPKLEVVGDVATSVSKEQGMPGYISILSQAESYEEDSIDNYLSEKSNINIYGIGACDLYHPIAHFAMPNQNFIYECNVFKGMERGVNVGTEYIRSTIDMTEEEKEYCRQHFFNYTGSLAFNSSIFQGDYDYVIMSFHDDEVFKIYEKKDNPNIRILFSPDKIFGDTSVINISDEETTYEEQREWLAREFEPGHFITPERFKDNIKFIEKHLGEKTKIVLITGPEMDYFRDHTPHCPEVREQIIALNKVLWELEKENPEKYAVADINNVIKTRKDVTNYVYHLKAKTAYNLFVEIVMTIVNKLGLNPEKTMLADIIQDRKVIIFGNNAETRNAYYNLTIGGLKPKTFIHFDHMDKKVLGRLVEDCKPYLDEGKNKYYFVVADEKGYGYIKTLLEKKGYALGKDYIKLRKRQYTKVWNEVDINK